jgi:methionyl-tRNA synthetase
MRWSSCRPTCLHATAGFAAATFASSAARTTPCGRSRPTSPIVRLIDRALAVFDLRAATSALWETVAETNRFVSATRPWALVEAARSGDARQSDRLDAILTVLLEACEVVAGELRPFLPLAAERITTALAELDERQARVLFPKFEAIA